MTLLLKNAGFSLVEVLVAIVVSSIALLNLAAGAIASLRYANNSFNYTVSLIQANNAIERLWINVCELQDGRQVFDANYINNNISPQISDYHLAIPPSLDFSNEVQVTITWTDERMTDGLANQVILNASFPQLPAGC